MSSCSPGRKMATDGCDATEEAEDGEEEGEEGVVEQTAEYGLLPAVAEEGEMPLLLLFPSTAAAAAALLLP